MAKLIYHNTFKFGVELSRKGQFVDCRFNNEYKPKTIANTFIKDVDESLIKFMKNKIEDDSFYYNTQVKGREYFSQGRVKEISYLQDPSITAKVKGNRTYTVHVYKKNNSYNAICTCPVGLKCKHIYATYLEMDKIVNDLNSNTYSKSLLDNELKKNIDYIVSQRMVNPVSLLTIIDILESASLEAVKSCLKYLDNNYKYSQVTRELLFILTLNIKIRKKFESIVINDPSIPFKNNILDNCKKAYVFDNDINKPNRNEAAFYLLVNKRYEDLVLFALSSKRIDLDGFIKFAFEKVDLNGPFFTKYLNTIKEGENLSFYDRYMFKYFNNCQREELLTLEKFDAEIDYEYLKDLNKDIRRQYLLRMPIGGRETYEEIIKKEFDPNEDLDFIIRFIEKYKNNFQRIDSPQIRQILKLVNNKYFSDYVLYYDYYFYGDYIIYQEDKLDKVNASKLEEYFSYDYSVSREEYSNDDEEINVCYILKDRLGKKVIEIEKGTDSYYLSLNSIKDKNNLVANYLIGKIEKDYQEEIESKINKIKQQIKKEKELEKLKMAVDSMISANESTNNYTLFVNNKKASLQYFVNTEGEESYYSSKYSLSLKVGIDKFYVVKNIRDFKDKFLNREKVNYGKDLTLIHDIDNFIKEDQEILKVLLSSDMNNFYGRAQNGNINEFLLNFLITQLKDRTIYINKIPYTVTLSEKEFKATLDEEYNFKLENYDENLEVLDILDNVYLLDKTNKKIDILKCEKQDIPFYKFALEYSGICIKEINEAFKENIYSNYFSNIEVSEKLKEEYKVENLLIDSYFDYKDKTITLRNEYFLGDKKIDKSKVTNNLDLARLSNYEFLIDSLGFIENVIEDDGDILNFFNLDFTNLKRYGNVYLSESIQNKQLSKFYPEKIVIRQNSTVMEAIYSDSKYSDEELYQIIKSIRHKKKYILLSDDRIVDLSDENAQEFKNTVEDLGLDAKNLSEPTVLPIINSLKALSHEKYCDVDEYLTNMINDISNFKNAKYEVPKINAELRSYQEEGYKWLKVLSNYQMGGILADDMGLGKTIQIITLITSDNTKEPSLIVCPKSLVFNWKNEFNRFSPDTKVVELYGLKEERDKHIQKISKKEKIVYITSYESLLRDIDGYKFEFNYLVIDEAQSIKNVNAQKTKSIKKLKAKHKFALTGTPIENNVVDLYSIFDFVLPGYFTDVNEFKNNNDNDEFIKKLSKAIGPFVLRRTKENVLKELPEKYERLLTCEMNPKQRKIYDAHKKQAQDMIERTGSSFDILPYLMRLRQICIDPSILIEDYKDGASKIDTLMELVREYVTNGHKILLFSSFVKALDVVAAKLNKEEIKYFTITGDTPAQKRIDIVNKFNNNSEEKIALISLKAGGTGLNLIGADTVIHLDPWWNVAAENQATDRSHRIGQTKNVEVIKIICEDSIEQRVIELQNIKKDLVDKVISNSDKTVTNASLEDIKFILD